VCSSPLCHQFAVNVVAGVPGVGISTWLSKKNRGPGWGPLRMTRCALAPSALSSRS
jgi:hypothetical protein